MGNSHLLALPEELIAIIAEHIAVDSLFDFALACAETYRHVEHRLVENQNHHAEHKIQHDRPPLQASKLLRLALNEPEAFWHLRAFESWGSRPGFEQWKSYRLDHDVADDDRENLFGPEEDYSTTDDSYYTPEEIAQYRDIMLEDLHMPPSEVETWIQRTRQSWDEPIKGVLFALAPKLDRLNFIAYAGVHTHSRPHERHPLSLFCRSIRTVYNSIASGGLWPAEFQSLRNISICNSTTLQHPHDAYYMAPSHVAPLFLLPNIKILNLTLLGYSADDDPDFFLPPKSSTVEELAFSCCDLSLQAVIKLLHACKRLRLYLSASSSLGNGGKNGPELLRVLIRCHGPSLESLSFSGSATRKYMGILHAVATAFPNLRICTWIPGYGSNPNQLENEIVLNEVLRAVADLVEDPRFEQIKVVCLDSLLRQGGQAELDRDALRRIKARGIDIHEGDDVSRHTYIHRRDQHRDGNSGLAENETDPRYGVEAM